MTDEAKAYNMFVPWTWEEFLNAPADICQMYIDRLSMTYNMNIILLAEMFHRSSSTVWEGMQKKGIVFKSPRGKTQEKARESFTEFMNRVPAVEEFIPGEPSEPVLVPVEQKHDDAPDVLASCASAIRKAFGLNDEEETDMDDILMPSLKEYSISFEGPYNEDYISKILANVCVCPEKHYVIRIEVKEAE